MVHHIWLKLVTYAANSTSKTALDNDHKEIHFSLNYIDSIRPDTRLVHEITGVLTHELVHCFQWDALGTCPGGLIEGVADWVRLNCDLSPLHWKRETDGDWDRGYQHTAYFLEYLEQRFGEGTVRRLNEKLRGNKYQAESFWPELLGKPVEQLYKDYVDKSKSDERDSRQ
ncbi:8e7911f8-0ef3-4f75-9ca2-39928c5973e6 [Thermothielavioides terrestris]|uniref:8e7911f8-0ef3-4f75-9ca2-39928c5973e6 n=1 Tax=Thermothielavioides terrestris TaxID=2587410 RepID=A0A446BBU5_9PEZI|nr:8e7911f8-0ef3-4f75-9ca2-39928c5973e6 [Thermothielavioides terrestris]